MSMKRSQPTRLNKAQSLLTLKGVFAGAWFGGRENRSAPMTRRLDGAPSMYCCHALPSACQSGDSDLPADPRTSLNKLVLSDTRVFVSRYNGSEGLS